MNKIPVYFMPGMAANPLIFERIKLDATLFEVCYLEWEIPKLNETLVDYTKRIASHIKHENPVLIGVSFGGIVVQEIAKIIKVRRVIIVSSVKTSSEFPKRIQLAKKTFVYKLIPMQLLLHLGNWAKLLSGDKMKGRMQLYDTFLSVRDVHYLKWSIEKVIFWNCSLSDEQVIHIHGNKDRMFPIQNIKKCIVVEGGTHIMIMTKYRWFNENLPGIILGDNTEFNC